MNRLSTALAALAISAPALAQQDPPSPAAVPVDRPHAGTPQPAGRFSSLRVLLQWENDGAFMNPFTDSDKHYTNGTELQVAWNPGPNDDLLWKLPFADRFDPASRRSAMGVSFGQLMFTPNNLELTALQPDERPYAAYLYGSLFAQRADEHHFENLELQLGIVGPNAFGEEIQTFVHSVFSASVKPEGWDNQLRDEFGVNLNYRHRWRSPIVSLGAFESQAIPALGFDLGNVRTDINAGLTIRAGYNLPDDFGPGTINDATDHTGGWTGDFGAYAYGRVTGQWVVRDIFLDGNTFVDSHSVDKESFFAEAQLGVMLHYKWLEAGWSLTWFGEAYELQDSTEAYGGYFLNVRFDHR